MGRLAPGAGIGIRDSKDPDGGLIGLASAPFTKLVARIRRGVVVEGCGCAARLLAVSGGPIVSGGPLPVRDLVRAPGGGSSRYT
ncbi:DUF397 domain-containing protein [Actinomadura sp. NTSP31]|uniref:DUF397 domain-containing protein n=1 Tax=Actinomadura sp. NTSP31 TaxID=1735447 RepID=UPI0035BF08FD